MDKPGLHFSCHCLTCQRLSNIVKSIHDYSINTEYCTKYSDDGCNIVSEISIIFNIVAHIVINITYSIKYLSDDDINDKPFTTLLSAQICLLPLCYLHGYAVYHTAICADSSVVKGISFMSSKLLSGDLDSIPLLRRFKL